MTQPLDVAALPASAADRAEALKERSRPDPRRPRLSHDAEVLQEEVDRKSAECYEVLEDITYRLHRVAKRIENGHGQHDVGLEARAATTH
jgi:hypothetical protein